MFLPRRQRPKHVSRVNGETFAMESNMTIMNSADTLIGREVERLFRESPDQYWGARIFINPVIGGGYVPGDDPIEPQMEAACRALLAREWFAIHGPPDAQPLPLSYNAREDLKGRGLLRHIVKWYARSLEGREYDVKEHPSFADYASGVLWEAELPVGGLVSLPNYPPDELRELKKRFPPRMLKGMGPGLCWLPPKLHAEAMASVRRSYRDGEVYLNRE
jgi:hypothetical protein